LRKFKKPKKKRKEKKRNKKLEGKIGNQSSQTPENNPSIHTPQIYRIRRDPAEKSKIKK
jgi:hypothetical protein